MSTYHRGHIVDGNVLRDTDAQVAAKRQSAERRKCPRCGRKSALRRVDLHDGFVRGSLCRWDDCGYNHTYDPFAETESEARARWARDDADHLAHAMVPRNQFD